jgi:hypothetical protein
MCHVLFIVMLNNFNLSVIMLSVTIDLLIYMNVVMLEVVAPNWTAIVV